jgi:hypothetical protein
MKALVYFCRWQGAALRLRGRDDTAVWGELAFPTPDASEITQEFHFYLKTRQLILHLPDGDQTLNLDDMGTTIEKMVNDQQPTTNNH